MTAGTAFKVGDHVRLSQLGKKHTLVKKSGRIAGVPKAGSTILVLFDGNNMPTRIHRYRIGGYDRREPFTKDSEGKGRNRGQRRDSGR
jgi:hypothetical protein